MENYDYCIIGTGPTGLTLAWYLAKYKKKVLLIDKESTIGGCHRVRRVDGLFTEHGPRIYLDNYKCFIDLLQDMGLDFYDLFTQYNFTINSTMSENLSKFTANEILVLGLAFMNFFINDIPSKTITMKQFTKNNNFSIEATKHIDNLCRLIDGGTIDNFTLFEFLQTVNQNYFYNIYQPKLPNDVGLFKHWQSALEKTNMVDFMFDTEVVNIFATDKVHNITVKNDNSKIINAKNFIFAIPPQPMMKIIENSSNSDMFGNFDKLVTWEKDTRYLVYIPISFHWDSKLKLPKKWGLAETDYSIVYVVLSDYMAFDDDRSKTVITCSVKATDRKSRFNGKTADECNEKELIDEVFRQLKEHQPNIIEPTFSIISPGVYKNGNKWDTYDTAYFYTKAGYVNNKSIYDNLFWCGTHNGNSKYSFTAMESAIENSISLLHDIVPESSEIVIHSIFTIRKMLVIMLFLVVFIVLYYLNY